MKDNQVIRFFDIKVPSCDRLDLSLTKIHGIGSSIAAKLCRNTGILPGTPVGGLDEGHLNRLSDFLKDYRYGGALNVYLRDNANNGLRSGEDRYLRQKRGLPSRGQRTRTNGKTAKRINSRRFKR